MNRIIFIIKNNCFMLKYIFKYTPTLVLYSIAMNIYSGLVSTFTGIYVAKYILDSLQLHRKFSHVIIFLILVVGANIMSSILEGYYMEILYLKKKEILSQKMHMELLEKARNMDISCYDDPNFYNEFVLATAQSTGKALEVLDTVSAFLKQVSQIVSISALILTINWVGIIIVLFVGIVSFFLQSIINNKEYKLTIEQVSLQRKRDYISRVFYSSDYVKELRLSNVKNKLVGTFCNSNHVLIQKLHDYGKKLFCFQIIDRVLNNFFLLNGVYVLYLCWLVLVKKNLSYGGFIALYQGCINLCNSIYSTTQLMTLFQKHSLYIDRFRGFLNYENKLKDGKTNLISLKNNIIFELKNVCFKYSNEKHYSLYNINIKIRQGEKVAIVGFNGAGKSTLIKLIMHLYDVTEGVIKIAGKNICDFSSEEYYKIFGVVFQDYKLFAATIAENVMMDIVGQNDEKTVISSLDKTDFTKKLSELPEGITTLLTKEFSKNGVNLSGGESQKLAIARVFAHKCPIIILDEPSSSLDPMTEYYLNQNILNCAKDKTIIYISHRLSTTRMADRIIMLKEAFL